MKVFAPRKLMWMNDEPPEKLSSDADASTCAQKDLGEQSATRKEDHSPRPDLTLPNPPIEISAHDMGPKVQTGYARERTHRKRNQCEMALHDQQTSADQ